MNIFQENIYLKPYLIIISQGKQKEEFLFIGNLEPENKKIVQKLSDNLGNIDKLTQKEIIELEWN